MGFAISTLCPDCNAVLRVRSNRRDGHHFVGCSRYPRCNFTSDYDELIEDLGEKIERLEDWVRYLRGELRDAGNDRDAGMIQSAEVDDKLKGLVFELHPDRRGEAISTTEVTQRINDLRSRLHAGGG